MRGKVGFTESRGYACLEDLQQMVNFASMSGIYLEYCGYEQCESGFKVKEHKRENYVIHVIVEGKGVFYLRNKKYELGKGKVFLIYPGEPITYQADEKEPWYYMWIGFRGYRCEEYLTHMGFSKENPIVEIQETKQIQECIMNILKAKELTIEDEVVRMSQFLQIMAFFMKENRIKEKGPTPNSPSSVYVEYAVKYIQMHYKEKIKIDKIANLIGISRSYLTRIFKKEFQISPQEYLIQLRLEDAAHMLKSTAEPIHVIALQCGYTDALSFSKAFKQQYGMSPKGYRTSKKEKTEENELM